MKKINLNIFDTPIVMIYIGCIILYFVLFGIISASASERPTSANENIEIPQKATQSNWSLSLGGGIAVVPEFEGSDKYEASALPLIEVGYADRVFLSSTKGLGLYVFKQPTWNAGVVANYNFGRKEKDSDLLKGMGDIDGGAELGGFVEWAPEPFSVMLQVTQGTGDVQGTRATLSLGHKLALSDRLQWGNSVSTTFASSRYNDTFFGISKKQSENSRYRYKEYNAGSGIKDAAFSTEITWAITDNISMIALGQYTRLTGPAADSPLVEKGSKNQFMAGLGFVYSFGN